MLEKKKKIRSKKESRQKLFCLLRYLHFKVEPLQWGTSVCDVNKQYFLSKILYFIFEANVKIFQRFNEQYKQENV